MIDGLYNDADAVDIMRNVNRAEDVSNRFFGFLREDAAETGARELPPASRRSGSSSGNHRAVQNTGTRHPPGSPLLLTKRAAV